MHTFSEYVLGCFFFAKANRKRHTHRLDWNIFESPSALKVLLTYLDRWLIYWHACLINKCAMDFKPFNKPSVKLPDAFICFCHHGLKHIRHPMRKSKNEKRRRRTRRNKKSGYLKCSSCINPKLSISETLWCMWMSMKIKRKKILLRIESLMDSLLIQRMYPLY